jgi:hypothetical protein
MLSDEILFAGNSVHMYFVRVRDETITGSAGIPIEKLGEMKEWWHSWWWIVLSAVLFLFSLLFPFLLQGEY